MKQWVGFVAMCLGLFMAILDIQIVASALPQISASLHIPLDGLSWIQTAYLITESIGIAMSARLSSAMSSRWLFACGSLGFALASFACGRSHSFASLIVWRSLQGIAGGVITPIVFAAGYKMFSFDVKQRAIVLAGTVIMLAPSIGPFLGGYIAQNATWHWIFYINVPLGILVATVVAFTVRVDEGRFAAWRTIDVFAFIALSCGLAALQILLKVAPEDHWLSVRAYVLLCVVAVSGFIFIERCLNRPNPLVDLSPLHSASFSAASILNFVLGASLFASVYLTSLFLGFVRYHTALEIGQIMTVAGVAQLLAAPFAAWADKKIPSGRLAVCGFLLLALGTFSNAFQMPRTDFAGLFLPQVERGAAVLFCIVSITGLALDPLPTSEVSNASGLLNLMRNIGGAVGIGIVDTIINIRPPEIVSGILVALQRDDAAKAAFVGIPSGFLAGSSGNPDASDLAFIKPIIERAAATIAFNEAWLLVSATIVASLLVLPLVAMYRHRYRKAATSEQCV
jgi:MFS transporter, DHA2 family, multidrug resistance protein